MALIPYNLGEVRKTHLVKCTGRRRQRSHVDKSNGLRLITDVELGQWSWLMDRERFSTDSFIRDAILGYAYHQILIRVYELMYQRDDSRRNPISARSTLWATHFRMPWRKGEIRP